MENATPINTKATQLKAQQEKSDQEVYQWNQNGKIPHKNNSNKLEILDTSVIAEKNISSAKKKNKEERNKRRIGLDSTNKNEEVEIDVPDMEINNNATKKYYYDFLRIILIHDNKKEYDLFEALNNSNAGITFAQLFAVSPLLRRLCIKGLKLNPKDIRKINAVHHTNLDENDSDFLLNILKNINTDYKSTTLENEKIVEPDLSDLNTKRINLINKANIAAVIGSINKHVVKVLVDTGAEVNIINKSFFELIAKNRKVQILERNYFKVPGKNKTSTNQVINLSLKFKNLVINAPFYILDDNDPSYDIIRG